MQTDQSVKRGITCETSASCDVDSRENNGLIRVLPWDSRFFGVNVAAIDGDRFNQASLEEVYLRCRQHNVELLYLECDVADRKSIRTAETQGFKLVDTRLRFAKPVFPGSSCEKFVRRAEPADADGMSRMAGEMYKDSRFYFDENIPDSRCSQLYRQWITNSLDGFEDVVFVAEHDNQIAGFISGKYRERHGEIGLIGVGAKFGGQGIGGALLRTIESDFAAQGLEQCRVLTQARNVPAQRLYAKNGYKVERLTHFYHNWFRK